MKVTHVLTTTAMLFILSNGETTRMNVAVSSAHGQTTRKIRLGIYDNRAIALAYAPSRYNPVGEKMAEFKKAKASGDTARARELEEWGQKHQKQLHRQGFGRVPVDDILALVKDKLPEVARKTGVTAIVWQCDYPGPDIEIVDITDDLVNIFDPPEKTRKWIKEMKNKPIIDLDEIEKIKD
jgi:hypothetical protein